MTIFLFCRNKAPLTNLQNISACLSLSGYRSNLQSKALKRRDSFTRSLRSGHKQKLRGV
jgi:hypothetical protein